MLAVTRLHAWAMVIFLGTLPAATLAQHHGGHHGGGHFGGHFGGHHGAIGGHFGGHVDIGHGVHIGGHIGHGLGHDLIDHHVGLDHHFGFLDHHDIVHHELHHYEPHHAAFFLYGVNVYVPVGYYSYYYGPWPYWQYYYPFPYGSVYADPVTPRRVVQRAQRSTTSPVRRQGASANRSSQDQNDPRVVGARFLQRAREAFRRGNYRQAARMASHAAVELPRDPEVHQMVALALFALGDYPGAAAAAAAALANGQPWRWPELRAQYASVSTYEAQLRKLEKRVRDHPNDVPARFLLAYHYLVLGHARVAREELQALVRVEPRHQLAQGLLKWLTDGYPNGQPWQPARWLPGPPSRPSSPPAANTPGPQPRPLPEPTTPPRQQP